MSMEADQAGPQDELRERLLRWFGANQRDLPWRKAYSPYEVWISEVMLQQTQVKTVLPYYQRWMERFENIPSVAVAFEDELLKYWEGLGYYSRVHNIHKTAKILLEYFGGNFPREFPKILSLPGIGRYTAGAIMSLAYNESFPAVDGNIERVFARLFNIATPVKDASNQKFIWTTAAQWIPVGRARRFNQALMELGALVCVPKKPLCGGCPIDEFCQGFKWGVANERPVARQTKRIKAIEAAIGVLIQKGKVLIQKRPTNGLMAGLWEFPGGRLNRGERPEEALEREFFEELGLKVTCTTRIITIRHAYTSFRVTLHAFFCRLLEPAQRPTLNAASEARWVTRNQLEQFPFPAANKKLIGILAEKKWPTDGY